MLLCVLSSLIQGSIMKNRSTNKRVSGRYYWWAHTAPVEVLHRRVRSEPPHIKDAFHMLRDNTACLFLSEVIKKKYDFGGVLEKAEIENFKFHDLRHTFATRLAQSGIDIYKTAKLLGHEDIRMTQKYTHHCPESLRYGVEILESYYNAKK